MNEEKNWISDSGNYYGSGIKAKMPLSINYGSGIKAKMPLSINYGSISNGTHPLEHRIEELEKKINKIIEFLNKFLDTNIKT